MNPEQESQKGLSLDEQAMLQAHKARLDNYTESNKALFDFTKMSIRGTMLANGVAAMSVFYAKADYLYGTLWTFALGAAFSLMCSLCAYLCQYEITKGWALHFRKIPGCILDDKENQELKDKQASIDRRSRLLRIAAISCGILSLILFLSGALLITRQVLAL